MKHSKEEALQAAKTIAEFCRENVCYKCPLNIGKKSDSILDAKCVCDYNIVHLPSTWKIEELKNAVEE